MLESIVVELIVVSLVMVICFVTIKYFYKKYPLRMQIAILVSVSFVLINLSEHHHPYWAAGLFALFVWVIFRYKSKNKTKNTKNKEVANINNIVQVHNINYNQNDKMQESILATFDGE